MLIYTLIFVIIAVIRTGTTVARKKANLLVLIEIYSARIGLVKFVVIIKFTAFACALAFFLFYRYRAVFHNAKLLSGII